MPDVVDNKAKKFGGIPGPRIDYSKIKDPEVKKAILEIEKHILMLQKELSVALI